MRKGLLALRHCSDLHGSTLSISAVSASETETKSSCHTQVEQRKSSVLKFKPKWKPQFLMWPAHSLSSSRSSEDIVYEEMVCILCNVKMKAKCSTANCHQERKHPKSKLSTSGKRSRVAVHYESTF